MIKQTVNTQIESKIQRDIFDFEKLSMPKTISISNKERYPLREKENNIPKNPNNKSMV